MSFQFLLGTHKPAWLADPTFASVPLFVSRRTLAPMKRLPRAVGSWALDSGGFTEIAMHGEWKTSAAEYVSQVRRFRDEIGGLAWAAPRDWMCEPVMLQKTGLTVEEHQRRTIADYLDLRSRAPDLPFVPVLQGWRVVDYWRHADAYAEAGIDLASLPLVGVGSVCRRQSTGEAETIMRTLANDGLRLHGFGFKMQGIQRCGDAMASADSLAWSKHAIKRPCLPGHDKPGDGRRTGHKNGANCAGYALQWRARLLDMIPDAARLAA